MGLKWHYFLSRFSLFAGATVSAIVAVSMFATASRMYGYGGIAVLIGLLLLAYAGMSVYAGVKLIKWEWSGVSVLKALYWISLIISVITLFISGLSQLVSVAGTGLMIWANTVYYNKRRDLFDCSNEYRMEMLGKTADAPTGSTAVQVGFARPWNLIGAIAGLAYAGNELYYVIRTLSVYGFDMYLIPTILTFAVFCVISVGLLMRKHLPLMIGYILFAVESLLTRSGVLNAILYGSSIDFIFRSISRSLWSILLLCVGVIMALLCSRKKTTLCSRSSRQSCRSRHVSYVCMV